MSLLRIHGPFRNRLLAAVCDQAYVPEDLSPQPPPRKQQSQTLTPRHLRRKGSLGFGVEPLLVAYLTTKTLFFYLQFWYPPPAPHTHTNAPHWMAILLKSPKDTEHLLYVRHSASESEDSGEQNGGSDFKDLTKQQLSTC